MRNGFLPILCLLFAALTLLSEFADSGTERSFWFSEAGGMLRVSAETEAAEEDAISTSEEESEEVSETEPQLVVTSEVPFRYQEKPIWFKVLLAAVIVLVIALILVLVLWQVSRYRQKQRKQRLRRMHERRRSERESGSSRGRDARQKGRSRARKRR